MNPRLASINKYTGMLSTAFQQEAFKKDGERHFTEVCGDRTRSNGFILQEGRFKLNIRKNFCPVRVLRQRKRMPREIVAAPSSSSVIDGVNEWK